MSQPAVDGRDAVFLSYCHDDERWRRKFTQILAPVVRNQRLVLWDDTQIPAGDDWRRDIDDGVRRASVALVLVSGGYLASRFIMEEELPALIERGVRLVPVLVEDCLWDAEPRLTAVQWTHDPGRDGPLAAARPREVAGRIVRVCRGLLAVAPLDGQGPLVTGPVHPGAVPGVGEVLPRGTAGVLDGVPELPPGYLVRGELDGVRAALLGGGVRAVGLTGDARALGLSGQGGIGKTVLAAAIAREPEVREHFPGGVYWVTVGEDPDLAELQAGLLTRLGVTGAVSRSAWERAKLLRQALAGRQVLLVADDVWSADAAQAFGVTGPRGRVLYTTRDAAVLAAAGAAQERVGVLAAAAARRLLARTARQPEDQLPEAAADRVVAATGGVALAVALAGGAVRGGASWEQVADELDRGTDTFLDHPYATAFKALQAATSALDPDLAAAYVSLAVYPPDIRVPVAAVVRYWGQLRGRTPEGVRADLRALADRELLVLSQDEISFHDLQHDYLLLQADDLALLHADLLAGYRALLAVPAAGWWQLPPGEPYIWDHLLHHLLGAGDRAGARRTLTDLAYVVMRVALAGPHAAEAGLARALAAFPGDRLIGWLRLWVARHAHVLTGLTRPADVAATIAGWLTRAPSGISLDRLGPLLPETYLVPRWGLPDENPALQRVYTGHTDWVTAVAFSPDGRHLATASRDQTIRLWDTATGTTTATLTGHAGPVYAVTFSPDGHHLATASDDQTARLWDTATGTTTATLTGHAGPVYAVTFSPDGRHLATASHDQTIRLWDTTTGTTTATLTGHTSTVTAVAFSPDGRHLATASNDQTARLWDTTTGTTTATLTGHTSWVTAVAFSPDGRHLATASRDETARLWDTTTGTTTATLTGHTSPVTAVAFSPDGRHLATASHDQTARLWDTTTGTTTATLTGHTSPVTAVAFSPDGRHLATASRDQTARLWDTATGTTTATLTGHTSTVTAVAFSPDGRHLATASHDRTARLWDTTAGATTATLTGHASMVTAVAFSPDGRHLATASHDETARLWDTATGATTATLTGHASMVTAVAFSPDGRHLATASRDRTARLWDTAAGATTATLTGHTDWVTAVAFSPDGRHLATASDDRTARLWDTATGATTATLTGHASMVTAVAFSPDGRHLATASSDRTIRLWDTATGATTATLTGHASTVTAVAFSPDGRHLATASWDQTIRLWDVKAAKLMSVLRRDAPVFGLAWSQDLIALGEGTSVVLLEVQHVNP